MIDRVQPVNNRLYYWHKYKPYFAKSLSNKTNNPEAFNNINSVLWEIISKADIFNNRIDSYIKTAIRRWCERLSIYLGYKYNHNKLTIVSLDDNNIKVPSLNITLDEYIQYKYLYKFINKLPERDRDIIKKYYGLNGQSTMKLKDIAEEQNVTLSMIKKIKDRALRKLRDIIVNSGLQMEDL